jgi:CheY-like chemotaxis protein
VRQITFGAAHCPYENSRLWLAPIGRQEIVTGDEISHIIRAAAGLLWVLLAAFVVWLLRQPLTALVTRLASFEAFGVKFALSGGAALDAAIELAEKNPAWPVEVPAGDRKAAIDRANAHRSVFEGAEILWVDDRPSNNRNEARMLRSFGALITFAATTDEASRALQTSAEQHQPFDIIISDISRDLPQSDRRSFYAAATARSWLSATGHLLCRPCRTGRRRAGRCLRTDQPARPASPACYRRAVPSAEETLMAEGLDDFPFDWIAADLREGICIPFLGAGASTFPKDIDAKPPTSRALALELARESRYPPYQIVRETAGPNDAEAQERLVRARLDCENLMLVSSWVEHGTGDRTRLHRKLRQHLANQQNPLQPNTLHDLLARVAQQAPMVIMTTNYDDLIELALGQYEVPFDLFVVAIDRPAAQAGVQGATLFRPAGEDDLKPVTGEQQLLDLELDGGQLRLKRTALFKMHGHIDRRRGIEDTFVITEEDYISFLLGMGAGGLFPADLVTLMQMRTLLFLGYRLRDWNFRAWLDRARFIYSARRSYAVARDIEPAERDLWHQRKVEVFNGDLNEFVPRLDDALGQTPLPSS